MFSHIKLYHYPLSRSARVKFLLHELFDEDFEVHKMDMFQGEAMTPEYLAKNPNHAVPVLELTFEGGSVHTMIESGAMILFLADAFPDKKLAPPISDAAARADYLQIVQFHAAWMDMMLWQIRMNETLLPKEIRSVDIAQFNRDKLSNEIAPQLSDRIKANEYMCAGGFSAADCIAAQNINWARAYGICKEPVFDAYLSRLKQRPTFRQTFADAREFER